MPTERFFKDLSECNFVDGSIFTIVFPTGEFKAKKALCVKRKKAGKLHIEMQPMILYVV